MSSEVCFCDLVKAKRKTILANISPLVFVISSAFSIKIIDYQSQTNFFKVMIGT